MATDSDRKAQFNEAYRNLNLFPLVEADEIEKFRVAYAGLTLGTLETDILASTVGDKLIFTGHRGCGKSTLLNELAVSLRQEGLFVAIFSIADMVEMSDVNHINILYSIALKLLSQATKLRVPIAETTKNSLVNWFTQTKSTTYSQQLKQELSAGANFFDFFTGKLQKEGAFREEIKQTYERRISELSEQINQISLAIQSATQKEVLVIIDDLDKLDLAVVKSIFEDNIKALFSPRIRVIFTIPIAVVREPRLLAILESQAQIVLLSVTKFFDQIQARQPNPQPIEESVAMLEAVLRKRIAPELVEPGILRKIVLLSGGVLRELVRLAQQCCRECLLKLRMNEEVSNITINDEILTTAVKKLRNQFARPLGSKLYATLAETYKNFTPPDAKSEEFLELLHGLYVLEYENDDLWYDLHPLVTDLLKRRDLI